MDLIEQRCYYVVLSHAPPLGYIELLGQCEKCKFITWSISVRKDVGNKIKFWSDVYYNQNMLNELEYDEEEDCLMHLKCGGKVKLYRMN